MERKLPDPILAYRAPPELIAAVDALAAAEGISRSDYARRALMRDLRANAQPSGGEAA